MNNRSPDRDWESDMTAAVNREFDQRVRDLNEAPLTLDHVKGKAMSIKRNRRLAVAGGVLAAAAVILPVAIVAGNGLGRTDELPPASSSSDPDQTPTEAVDTANPTPAAPAGPAYLDGDTLHRADGSTLQLPEAYAGGAELGEEFLGTRPLGDGGRRVMDIVSSDGTVLESIDVVSGPVANADGTTAAYVAPGGSLMTLWSTDPADRVELTSGLGPNDFPVAVTGGPSCFEDADGCRVFLNDGNGQTAPEVVASDGSVDVAVPDGLKIYDVAADGRITVQNKSKIAGSCNGVYDEPAGGYVFETCESSLFDFSPDGTRLSGYDDYLDGIGDGFRTILDATSGEEVARFDPRDGFVAGSVWADDDDLMILAYEPAGWSIYRLGVDGSKERVVGPNPEGDDLTPAYVLLGS